MKEVEVWAFNRVVEGLGKGTLCGLGFLSFECPWLLNRYRAKWMLENSLRGVADPILTMESDPLLSGAPLMSI